MAFQASSEAVLVSFQFYLSSVVSRLEEIVSVVCSMALSKGFKPFT